jgi:hypothetical protein
MSALYDELCVFGHDEFVKTTTIYPLFVNTNPELVKLVADNYPLWSPELIARELVDGMLKDKRNIYIPKVAKSSLILK